jgi:hypothetical protein
MIDGSIIVMVFELNENLQGVVGMRPDTNTVMQKVPSFPICAVH